MFLKIACLLIIIYNFVSPLIFSKMYDSINEENKYDILLKVFYFIGTEWLVKLLIQICVKSYINNCIISIITIVYFVLVTISIVILVYLSINLDNLKVTIKKITTKSNKYTIKTFFERLLISSYWIYILILL